MSSNSPPEFPESPGEEIWASQLDIPNTLVGVLQKAICVHMKEISYAKTRATQRILALKDLLDKSTTFNTTVQFSDKNREMIFSAITEAIKKPNFSDDADFKKLKTTVEAALADLDGPGGNAGVGGATGMGATGGQGP